MSIRFNPDSQVDSNWQDLLLNSGYSKSEADNTEFMRELLQDKSVRESFNILVEASVGACELREAVDVFMNMTVGKLAALQAGLLFGGELSEVCFHITDQALEQAVINDEILKSIRVIQDGIYPGSFDPITLGHLDIIERSAKVFPRLIVALGVNEEKNPLFSKAERIEMIKEDTKHLGSRVLVMSFDGLLAHFGRENQPATIIRGVRGVTDIPKELTFATFNRNEGRKTLETFLLPSRNELRDVSSSIARNAARHNGDTLEDYVSKNVAQRLRAKFRTNLSSLADDPAY